MCFSATASFTSAAILLPTGLYCLKKANQLDKRYWAFAMLPLLFGVQQLLEGGVWLALSSSEEGQAYKLALGFLFFSHVFWLGWIPYSSNLTETSPVRYRAFQLIGIFGVLFGAAMYLPLLFNADWLTITIVRHSIDYTPVFFTDNYLPQWVVAIIYILVVLTPLLLSSDKYHRMLGLLVMVSGFATWLFFGWVFISVWCYFAAMVSMYIVYMIANSVPAAHERPSTV